MVRLITATFIFMFFTLPLTNAFAENGKKQKSDGERNSLSSKPWISVSGKGNVKFGDKAWRGTGDLSFKYKAAVSGGAFHVLVDVTDDKAILKKEDTVVSDHVEVWLADAELVDKVDGKIDQLEVFTTTTLKELIEDADREESTSCDDFRDTMQEVKYSAASLKSDSHYVQLVFNQGRLLPLPEKRISAGSAPARAIKFNIKPAPGGYSFSAVIPLEGLIDVFEGDVGELAFMIDVSDIDSAAAAKQESLMSSAKERRFGDPASFSRMKIEPELQMRLTPHLRMLSEIERDGYLRADASAPGGYLFFRDPGLFILDCHYWMLDDVPAEYVTFDVQPLKPLSGWPSSDAEIYANGQNLAIVAGDKVSVISLADKLNGSGAFEYKLLHRNDVYKPYPEGNRPKPYFDGAALLLQVTGASRFPMGNGLCGAGMETDAVFVQLDADMKPVKIASEAVESCYKNIIMNNLSLHLNDTSSAKGDVVIDFEQFEYDPEKKESRTIQKSLIYNGGEPSPGMTVEITGTEEDKD